VPAALPPPAVRVGAAVGGARHCWAGREGSPEAVLQDCQLGCSIPRVLWGQYCHTGVVQHVLWWSSTGGGYRQWHTRVAVQCGQSECAVSWGLAVAARAPTCC
jgi:hypothetical protein